MMKLDKPGSLRQAPVGRFAISDDDAAFDFSSFLPNGASAIPAMPSFLGMGRQAVAQTSSGLQPAAPMAAATAFAAGYDPKLDTAQWNVKAIFGAAAGALLAQYNGAGVHVGDYDDGIDKTNAALMTHYDASRELTINGVRADPGVLTGAGTGVHGTATAGIVSADAARTSGQLTGLAYGASLTSVNIFSGAASGAGILAAFKLMSTFDVTTNSYGWSSKWADAAGTVGSFGQIELANLGYAATTGRGGLGTVIVKSAGNDWLTDHRDAGTQEYNVDRHVVTVAAIGQDHHVTYYSQQGASVLVGAASNGGGAAITTTDRTGSAGYAAGDVTNGFGGTSASAPEVAAVVADMLSANGRLGARDVQSILALSAYDNETAAFQRGKTGNMGYDWIVNHAAGVNGGGFHQSNAEGFGELNGHDAIREAEVWSYFSPTPQTFGNEVHLAASAAGKAIATTAAGTAFTFVVTGSETVENADLTIRLNTGNMDHLKVLLTGPSGTQSILLDTSTTLAGETGNSGALTWTVGSHAFLGELAAGTWTATLVDTVAADRATVSSIALDLYGSAVTPGRVFHYNDEAAKMLAAEPARLVIHDKGGIGDWLDTAAMTANAAIDLRSGATSTANGKAFVTIGTDTAINKVTLGDGSDVVRLNDNWDVVVGGHGSHVIQGGAGADTIVAGWAGGTATGGAGADTFAFSHRAWGVETITDFTHGTDRIDLRGLGDTFASLKIAETVAATTILNVGGVGDAIVLANMHGVHLTASDFLFA
jgi:subtilisin-like proprotein convertase family protein